MLPRMTQPALPRIAVVDDPRFTAHAARGFHPERPERLEAARRGVEAAVGERRLAIAARAAEDADLARVHDDAYLTRLDHALRRGHGNLDGDTFFNAGTRDAAWFAA